MLLCKLNPLMEKVVSVQPFWD